MEAEAQARREVLQLQRELTTQDATAREQLTRLTREVKQDLANERSTLDKVRVELQAEQRRIDAERYWEPVIGNVITTAAAVLLCAAPLEDQHVKKVS